MTRESRAVFVLAILLGTPATAGAQTDTACTYDACSLHIRQDFMSTWVVRGMASQKVLKFGMIADGLDTLVANSDSAVLSARRFQHHQTVANMLGLGSMLSGLAAWLFAGDNEGLAIGSTVAGIGLSVLTGLERKTANNALERSLWWYNRTLAPSGPNRISTPPQ